MTRLRTWMMSFPESVLAARDFAILLAVWLMLSVLRYATEHGSIQFLSGYFSS
jgi:hypothetical protein